MDPRHPEDAIWRMEQLMVQFKFVLDKLNTETISSKLGEAEREGALVVQEICLVAPRLHEAMMQVSRQRRHDLAHGVAFNYTPEEKVGKYMKATIAIEEKTEEEEDPILVPPSVEKFIEKQKKKRKYTKKKKVEE